jgi:hypothetical protein
MLRVSEHAELASIPFQSRTAQIGRVTDTLFKALMADCSLSASGWMVPHNARVTWPNGGSGACHNDAELVHHGIDGLANIRRYGSDSHLGEMIPKQLRLRS